MVTNTSYNKNRLSRKAIPLKTAQKHKGLAGNPQKRIWREFLWTKIKIATAKITMEDTKEIQTCREKIKGKQNKLAPQQAARAQAAGYFPISRTSKAARAAAIPEGTTVSTARPPTSSRRARVHHTIRSMRAKLGEPVRHGSRPRWKARKKAISGIMRITRFISSPGTPTSQGKTKG